MNTTLLEHISRDELKTKLERSDKLVLIDALPPEHFRESHIPGAVNWSALAGNQTAVKLADKNAEIVVYCMNPT